MWEKEKANYGMLIEPTSDTNFSVRLQIQYFNPATNRIEAWPIAGYEMTAAGIWEWLTGQTGLPEQTCGSQKIYVDLPPPKSARTELEREKIREDKRQMIAKTFRIARLILREAAEWSLIK
jgi:hypothetical protein